MNPMKYTTEHEWLRVEDNGEITIGVTAYAQEQLGDIVYVELPAVGQRVDAGTDLVVIESVKAVGEVKLPIAGEVRAINERLNEEPELVNQAPLAEGWLLRLAPDGAVDLDSYMDAAAYQAFIASL